MESIVIRGNRLSVFFQEANRNITLLNREKITRRPVQSIPEILAYVPGVDIRQRGPMGVQSDISIRGGTFEQTLVLLNGIKLTDPQTGHHMLSVPLNYVNIDRIEILKGPGARIFGQNAFSGAVNFVTRIPEEKTLDMNLNGGDFKWYSGSLSLSVPIHKYKQNISISRNSSAGYRHNTDFKIDNVFYQSSLELWGGDLEFLGGITDRNFGANGFYATPDYTEQYEEVQTGFISLGYRKKSGKLMYNPKLYWRNNTDHYSLIRESPEVYQNLHNTNVAGLEINTGWENSWGITGLGIEYRIENIYGNWIRNGQKTGSNLNGFHRNNLGLFAEHKFNFRNKLDLTPGIYMANSTDSGWNIFPGIDVGYSWNDNVRIYGNAGKSYRIPNFYELYYQSPVEIGNPDLQTEEAISFETGIRVIKNGYNFEGNAFIQDANDLIDWVYIPVNDSSSIWKAENFTSVFRKGIETTLMVDFLRVYNRNYWIRSLNLSYNFIDSELKKNEYISRYVLENLRHQFIMGVDLRILKKLFFMIQARYNHRENKNSYWLIDTRLYWKQNKRLMIYTEATNLSDTEYTEVMTPMPGRWIRGGLRYQLFLDESNQ